MLYITLIDEHGQETEPFLMTRFYAEALNTQAPQPVLDALKTLESARSPVGAVGALAVVLPYPEGYVLARRYCQGHLLAHAIEEAAG